MTIPAWIPITAVGLPLMAAWTYLAWKVTGWVRDKLARRLARRLGIAETIGELWRATDTKDRP